MADFSPNLENQVKPEVQNKTGLVLKSPQGGIIPHVTNYEFKTIYETLIARLKYTAEYTLRPYLNFSKLLTID